MSFNQSIFRPLQIYFQQNFFLMNAFDLIALQNFNYSILIKKRILVFAFRLVYANNFADFANRFLYILVNN